MGGEPFEPRALAPLGEPRSKGLSGEGLAALVEQEHYGVVWSCGVDRLGQRGGNGDGERAAGFLLSDMDRTIANVATADSDHIGAAPGDPEQEGEGEPGPCAHRIGAFEGGNILLGPSPIAIALGQLHPHAGGGIALDDADADRVPDEQPQAAEEIASSDRSVGLDVEHAHHVLAGERDDAKIAVVAPQPFEDAPVLLLPTATAAARPSSRPPMGSYRSARRAV